MANCQEELTFFFVENISESLKYFSLTILTQKLSGSVRILQMSGICKEILVLSAVWSPEPPKALSTQMLFQLIEADT